MKLSIIVATRNRASYLNLLLESIKEASVLDGFNTELIILDNGSTDKTHEIIQYWTSRLQFRFFKNNDNYRGSLQYGKLVSLADGEWLISPGDDDVFIPKSLYNLANLCINGDLSKNTLIVGEALTINQYGEKLPKVYKPPKFKDNQMGLARTLFESPFWMPATAVRKDSIDLNIFPESLTTCDWWLWINGLTKGEIFYFEEPIVSYRIHDGQEQKTYLRKMWELDQLRVFLNDLQFGSLKSWISNLGKEEVVIFIESFKQELKSRHLNIVDLAISVDLLLNLRNANKINDSTTTELLINCGVDPRFANTWLKLSSQESDFYRAISIAKGLQKNIQMRNMRNSLSAEDLLNDCLRQIRNEEIDSTITPMERKIIEIYRTLKKLTVIRKWFNI